MKVKIIEASGIKIAMCESDEPVITDGQSTLDYIVSTGFEYGCRDIAINKAAIAEDFFRLSSGIAGEVSQKIVNYQLRLAIIGDFSGYTSKPLRDYMHESNRGGHLYFVKDEAEALEMLERAS